MECIVHGVTKSRARLSDFHSLGEETQLHGSWEPVTHLLTMWLDHMKTALLWFQSLVIIIPSGPFQTLLVDMLSSLLVFVETFVFLIWSLPLSSCQGLGMFPSLAFSALSLTSVFPLHTNHWTSRQSILESTSTFQSSLNMLSFWCGCAFNFEMNF